MSKLAILGNATRGKEVIEILEMLGGNNPHEYIADSDCLYFYIGDETRNIYYDWFYNFDGKDVTIFTIEEFLEKFPYKVGDKVTHNMGILMNIVHMHWDAECNVIRYDIQSPVDNNYKFKTMLAEHLQPYKEGILNKANKAIFDANAQCCDMMNNLIKKETMESKPNLLQQLKDYFDNTPRDVLEKEWHEYDKYNEIGPTVNEYLEYVNKSRQPKYPKTYEECYEILQVIHTEWYGYLGEVLVPFQKLLICRNAYWKIAGEQLGLGKSWKPDWSIYEHKFCLGTDKDKVIEECVTTGNRILAFPTKEMRDAFKENFDGDIDICKEFL